MSSPLLTFRDPALMTVAERHAEIVALLARGLGRFVADSPGRSQPTVASGKQSAETSLNQLDTRAQKSMYAADENA